MLWKICYFKGCEVAAFAARELKRYVSMIDKDADAVLLQMEGYDPNIENALWVGRDPSISYDLPDIPKDGDIELDDGILIDIDGNHGVISGVNPRSVLLAVYRYLSELGCSWIRPGPYGEIVPQKPLGADKVYVKEAPSYRHRTMIIEGSNAYDHVANLIEWIPKIGMSGLFIPFFAPYAFYERWYSHLDNPHLEATPVTIDETKAMAREHAAEAKKRGLLYHAVGHGWNCQAFGIDSNDWNVADRGVPGEYEKYFAMVNGKRGLFGGIPMLTNCCYSNSAARDMITSYVVEYSKNNRDVDYLHFWLSDSYNSHCECENCKDTTPSDYYVMMLNEIDEKLTLAGLNTKIVFLLYFDLLWEPQKTRINNPSRFVLMFAPISRTYSEPYADADLSGQMDLAPYARNRLTMPRSVEENVARLRRWQRMFKGGDSFIFDYHFFADHFKDPGYTQISKVLFNDIKNLDKLGLNGTVNCQLTRTFFPTGIGVSLMAKALWNKEAEYDSEAASYYHAAFGQRWQEVRDYLEKLSELFDPPYLRHEKPQVDSEAAKKLGSIDALISSFEQSTSDIEEDSPGVRKSWEFLRLHGQVCQLCAKALCYKAKGMPKEALTIYKDIESWARINDKNTADVLDFHKFVQTWKDIVEGDAPTMT